MIFSRNLATAVTTLLIVLIAMGLLLIADLSGISHAQGPFQAEIVLSLHPDPADGATGVIPEVPRVIDLASGEGTTVLLGGFQAQLTYDGNCLNILDVRELGFSIADLIIDNVSGTTTFIGNSPTGVELTADLAHILTRVLESNQRLCPLAITIASLTDSTGISMDVLPRTSTINIQRGDGRSDGVISIADALFISQYMARSRTNCATEVDTGCLHPVNAASVHPDGNVDRNTIADALFIAQYLVGLRDESYNIKTPGAQVVSILHTSPANGEGGVSVTQETIIEFSDAVEPESISPLSIGAQIGEQPLSARRQLSPDGKILTLFYNSPLPYSARVRITVDGGILRDTSGSAIDADGDGQPGGVTTIDFDTLSLPPDPANGAPALDLSVATALATATEFLYTGNSPIQTGVAPGTIEARRAAVLRGRVLTRDGQPLLGVAVTILGHPEFGQTLTRADGMFDMAVNGGGLLTVNYALEDFLTVQRQVQAPWEDYAFLPDVVVTPQDNQVTTITVGITSPMQVARGSVQADSDGTRQATVLFPEGTTAELVQPDGSTLPATTLNVRLTEYTVGQNGTEAMPAVLPPTSGYSYAVELGVDEAVAKVNGRDVVFNQPVFFYVENFLNFPVGEVVPVGYYDNTRGTWVPQPNGHVLAVLAVTAGLADLDVTGDGVADTGSSLTALGITDAERQQLASLYAAGTSLWRAPVSHFSTGDLNWPYGPPDDAKPPGRPRPDKPKLDDPCTQQGSTIGCETQTLGETVAIAGTPFRLHYQSDRVPARRAERTMEISLSGESVPSSLRRIELEVSMAGRRFSQSFPAAANQRTTFAWDGKDAYGRTLQGTQPFTARIGYVYGAVYLTGARLGRAFAAYSNGNATPVPARQEVTLWQEWQGRMGAWDARSQGMGGWSLNVHHAYDPSNQIHLGGGGQRSAERLGSVMTTVVGTGTNGFSGDGGPATQATLGQPRSVAFGPDGSLYIADFGNSRIRQVGPDGIINTVAGTGAFGFSGDGGPATQAALYPPTDVAVGPDGSLYIADENSSRIRQVRPDGIINTVAGNGAFGFSGDGGPATQAALSRPNGVAVGPDGSLYIADIGTPIRKVGPDGIITTVAGSTGGFSGDGGPATQASLSGPMDVALGPDGSLYIADRGNHRVRKVGPDGIINTVAGTSSNSSTGGFSGDGGLATQAMLSFPSGVAVGPDGSLYIADDGNLRIRQVGPDGIINSVAAIQPGSGLLRGVAVGPDGSLYIADTASRIRRVRTLLPGVSLSDLQIPAEDGSQLYIFNGAGKHLRTLDALTGALLYQFNYDGSGHLTSITDGDGNVTTIERDSNGNPTAIVAPFGQRTGLTVDGNGYLDSITNPAGEAVQVTSTPEGLLTRLTDPKGGIHQFTYDALGRLTRDDDPAGGFKTLTRTDTPNGYTVAVATALGRATTYGVEHLSTGGVKRTVVDPSGAMTETVISKDGSRVTTYADGTVVTLVEGPDPRWGMLAPVLTSLTTTIPSGLTQTVTGQRTATLADPANLLSLQSETDTVTVNGRTFTSRYDSATRQITTISPVGRQTITTLDVRGRIVQEMVSGLLPTSYAYDSRGRLSTITQGTGAETRTVSLTYNSNGHLDTITDPTGRIVNFGYDAAGRALNQTLPDGRAIAFTYDANSNVTSITPPGRPAHAFSYTSVDLVSEYTPPDVNPGSDQTQYTYDADRRASHVALPDGQAIDLGYDIAGRLNGLTIARGAFSYAYDTTSGNLATINAPGGNGLAYGYDGTLPTSEDWPGPVAGSLTRTFDNDFRETSNSVNGGDTVTSLYDQDSLLMQAGGMILARNPQNGLITGSTLGGVTDARSYNGFGEPVDYRAASSGTDFYDVQYTRDQLGRITEKTETNGGTTDTFNYTYDLAGRLTEVNRNGATTATYTYDSNGNRLSVTSSDGTLNGTYDAQDRLTQYGTTTYAYTPNGELLTKTTGGQTTTYEYDSLGNLMDVTLPDGTQIEYVIDGNNRRIGKKVDGVLAQGFLYEDELRITAELDGNGDIISRFVYATQVNVPELMISGTATYRIITDHLGSPRLVVDTATGQIVQRIDYDAFGNVLQDTNPGFQPFGFAGGLYDRDSRLVRFGARDYDAEMGRWMAKDPILFAAGDPNLYGYVVNDPVNLFDPEGLDWLDWQDWDLSGAANFSAGFGGIVSLGLTNWINKQTGADKFVNKCSGLYTAGQVAGVAHGLVLGGLRGGASLGGTRFAHILNHNRYLRVGPGRMPASGPFPASTSAPRLSIGPQRPGITNPHFDLRIRGID